MTHHATPSPARWGAYLVAAALLAVGILAVPSSAAPTGAELRITTSEDTSGGMPIEGSVNEIDVSRVVSGSLVPAFHVVIYRARPFTIRLRAGTHRITIAPRTCDGTCANLDPPATRCSRSVRLRAGERVSASARIAWGSPPTCRISLRRG
jgi:hypothetical protein